MTDIVAGVAICAVGGAIRLFAWSLNKEASQVASVKRIDNLSGILALLCCLWLRVLRPEMSPNESLRDAW